MPDAADTGTMQIFGIRFDLDHPLWRAWCAAFPLLFAGGVGSARGPALGMLSGVLLAPVFWWMAIAPRHSRRFSRDHPVAEAAIVGPSIGFFAAASLAPQWSLWVCAALTVPYAALVVLSARRRGGPRRVTKAASPGVQDERPQT